MSETILLPKLTFPRHIKETFPHIFLPCPSWSKGRVQGASRPKVRSRKLITTLLLASSNFSRLINFSHKLVIVRGRPIVPSVGPPEPRGALKKEINKIK